MLDPVARLTIALLLGWVLADAGLHKLREPLRFGAIIDAYRLLPSGWGGWLSRPLGFVELACACALLLPASQRAAAVVAGALFALYWAAMALNLVRGRRDIDCGCGGVPQPLSGALLLRNLLLLALAGWMAFGVHGERTTGWADLAVALAAALVAILVYAAAAQLAANRQRMVRDR